jgi:hypothetical protein
VIYGRSTRFKLTIEGDESSHGTSILHHIQKGARQYSDRCLVSAAAKHTLNSLTTINLAWFQEVLNSYVTDVKVLDLLWAWPIY